MTQSLGVDAMADPGRQVPFDRHSKRGKALAWPGTGPAAE